MSQPPDFHANGFNMDGFDRSEFDALCDAVFDGCASPEQVARLEELATASPALRRRYVELADQEASLAWAGGDLTAASASRAGAGANGDAAIPAAASRTAARPPIPDVWARRAATAATLAVVLVLGIWMSRPRPAAVAPPVGGAQPAAVWAASAGAELFGAPAPAVGQAAPFGREQALLAGWVQLRFARGAEAVLEGPAVFEIAADDRLILRAGRCSVHAPEGAEGFRVETPDGEVVDLGTRFAVRVPEGDAAADGGTEVHVIEGAAELHPAADLTATGSDRNGSDRTGSDGNGPAVAERLTTGQARRIAGSAPLTFDPAVYRGTLPDRVISYVAGDAADGATMLRALTVQRAGEGQNYRAEDLIPAAVTSFRNADAAPSFAAPTVAAGPLSDWLSREFALNAGRINPGGSSTPLSADPVTAGPDQTPGLSIQFQTPVTNGPGPDLVIFDLQSVVDPSNGDRFHLSPVKFRPGLRSLTVERFDLTVGDPGTTVVAPFMLPKLDPNAVPEAVTLNPAMPRLTPSLGFTANATAIDLSDLGYEPGESVRELFLQDALDDLKYIDPTVIVGLPVDPAVADSSDTLRRDTL